MLSGSNNGLPLEFSCSGVSINNFSVGGLVEVLIKHSKEQETELSILKRIKHPKNYIFGVYFNNQRYSTVVPLSNRGSKPFEVIPLKDGENIDRKFGYFESVSYTHLRAHET